MAVFVGREGLGGHIDRWANIILFGSSEFLLFDGKPKISDLGFRVMEEDVGRFEIPVNDSMGIEAFIAFDDLLKDFDGLIFC